MPLLKRSSYYEPDYRQGAALIRARRPFLFKNIAAGAAIIALEIGIYAYTMHAIGQDNFEDVKVPDAPLQPANTPHVVVNGSNSKV